MHPTKKSAGNTHTLAVNFPPAIAAAIRRTGNRSGSISKVIHSLIDQTRLAELLESDATHQRRCAESN